MSAEPVPEEVARPVDPPLQLPVAVVGADLPAATPDRRWIAFCFALTFVIYLAFIPRILLYSSPPTGDQPFYLMDADSIASDGDLNLANNYANRDFDRFYSQAPRPPGFVGIPAPYPLPPQLAYTPNRPASEQYSYHMPGLGVALVPSWIIGGWFHLWWPAGIVFMCLLGALLTVNVFLLAFAVTGRLAVAAAVWAAIAFSNPIMSYALLLFSELPTGLLLIYAFRRIALGWGANGVTRRILIGACIGYIPWLAWRCTPIALGLGLYAAVQWWRGRRLAAAEPASAGEALLLTRRHVLDALPLVLPVLLSIALLLRYNLFLFGQPTPNGILIGGGFPVFHWPWKSSDDLVQFVTGAFALLFDRQWGLLPFTPVYILAAAGIIAMVRTACPADRRLLLWGGVVLLPYAVSIAAFTYWGGSWCPPARYLTTLVPLLAAPLAVSLVWTSRMYRAIYAVLAVIGFGFMGLMLWYPHLMFPVERSFLLTWLATDPSSPLHINLLPLLPAFAWPDPGLQPTVTLRVIAFAFALVLLCSLLTGPRRPKRTHEFAWLGLPGPAWLGALILLAAGWLVMNQPFLGI